MSRPAPHRAPPLSLYLHFPWCESLCPYCDFNSHLPEAGLAKGGPNPQIDPQLDSQLAPRLDPQLAEAWAQGILRDLDQDLPLLEKAERGPLHSVFVGGGTPSLLPPQTLARLLERLRQALSMPPGLEITMEANPSSAEAANFRAYCQAGVNRLSLGVQSFQDGQLRSLGRVHDAEAAAQAVQAARGAGFARVNLDLMHGVQGQSPQQAAADLRRALQLWDGDGPGHISWYQLTLEPNTPFYSAPPKLPREAELEAIQRAGEKVLHGAGYARYEVSAWHRPGAEEGAPCAHNLHYWSFGDYLGLGPGAHTKLSFPGQGVLRWQRLRRPASWLRGDAVQDRPGRRWLGESDLRLEFMLNAMRLSQGVPQQRFVERTGLPLQALEPARSRAEELGLLEPGLLAPTELGRRMHNDLVQLFL